MGSHIRRILSICEPAGSGKSQLARVLVEVLGTERCVRVPTDYFQAHSDSAVNQPLLWDWVLLERVLALPDGTELTTPSFDFERMHRLAETGGRPFILRPLVVIDAIEPYPRSDLTVSIAAPEAVRRARIVARDEVWGSRVRDRWERLESTWRQILAAGPTFDLELDGTEPLRSNAARLAAWLSLPERQDDD